MNRLTCFLNVYVSQIDGEIKAVSYSVQQTNSRRAWISTNGNDLGETWNEDEMAGSCSLLTLVSFLL